MRLKVADIQKYCDPYVEICWHGLATPITCREIDLAIRLGNLGVAPLAHWPWPSRRRRHIERIAYFSVRGWDDPIWLEPGCGWLIQDGNHRFAAAIFLGLQDVLVDFGRLDEVECMFGRSAFEEAEREWGIAMLRPTSEREDAMEHSIAPIVLHYRTQNGQPYGSVSRKCSECGIMIWPEMQAVVPAWTDDRTQWLDPPDGYRNCMGHVSST